VTPDTPDHKTNVDEALRSAGITPSSYSRFFDVARVALEHVESLGVSWKGTRFQSYFDLLGAAASRSYPRRIEWHEKKSELVAELEAIGQTIQLGCATALREHVDRPILVERLRHVMSGRPEPTDDDKPRNTLLELATGFMLFHGGATVELTTAREDLVLRLPDVPPVPVECKRPLTGDSVERNVKKVRRQLESLRDRYPNGGLAVFGLDRVAGMSGDLGNADTPADLREAVRDVLDGGARNVARLGGPKLERAALGVMTVLVGAIYSLDPPLPTAVLRIASLPLPSHGRDERARIQAAVSAVFSSKTGPALDLLLR
jgi:hypothetical protein